MKKNSNKNISGFTLVELIVVIVILGVLSTIGFVSYVGYLEGVRDTNRISQVSNMQSGLEVLRSKDSFVPLPDDSVQVLSDTGSILTFQGYLGENLVNIINYSKSGKDPQSGSYYTYSVSADKKYFQIMAFLEEQANVTAFNVNQVKAIDYTNFYPYVVGDKLGILTQTGTNTPVQEITSIKTAGSLNLTTDTTNSYIVTSSNTRNITATGSNISTELNTLLTKIKSRGKNIEIVEEVSAPTGLYLWLLNAVTVTNPTTQQIGNNAANAVIKVSAATFTNQVGTAFPIPFSTDLTIEARAEHMCWLGDSSTLRLSFKKSDGSEDGYALFDRTADFHGRMRFYKGTTLLTTLGKLSGKTYSGGFHGNFTFSGGNLTFTPIDDLSTYGIEAGNVAYDFSNVASIELSGQAVTTYLSGCGAFSRAYLK